MPRIPTRVRTAALPAILPGLLSGLLLLSAPGAAHAADLTEAWERELREEAGREIALLIRGLDTPVVRRRPQVDALVRRGTGPNRDLALEMMHEAFDLYGIQVREGLVEVLARIGSPRSLPVLRRQVRFDTFPDVRILILRLAPAWLLASEPGLHGEGVARLLGEGTGVTDRLRRAFRRPPVRALDGRYDVEADRLRRAVEAILRSQLDPVGAAIEGLDSTRDELDAYAILRRYVGTELGRTTAEWADAWRAMRPDFESPAARELETLQVRALGSLTLVGAEMSEALAEELTVLAAHGTDPVVQAALHAAGELAGLARERLPAAEAALPELRTRPPGDEERLWVERTVTAGRRALALAGTLGREHLDDPREPVRVAAIRCLAATRKPEMVPLLERRRLRGGESAGVLTVLAEALGRIGGAEAVASLRLVSANPGYTADAQERREAYHALYAAMEALGRIVARGEEPGSGAAFAVLLERLADVRPVPAAPARPGGEPLTMQDLALHILQTAFGVTDESTDPADWRERHAARADRPASF
jgi:hypothetical protein